MAPWAIASTVFGVLPKVAPKPTLSNVTTRRSAGEGVDESGVPVVEVATEVLQQDERDITVTDVAVRVLDPILGRDSLRRGVGVRGSLVTPCLFVSACLGLSFHTAISDNGLVADCLGSLLDEIRDLLR